MLTHSLNFLIVTFLQVKVSVVNSARGSFCWNYAADAFYGNYADDNVYCMFAGFEVVLSVTGMLVDLSVRLCRWPFPLQLRSLKFLQHICRWPFPVADTWVTIFIVVMQMGVSVAVMQVVFSTVHYAYDCVYCNYAGHSLSVTISHSFL